MVGAIGIFCGRNKKVKSLLWCVLLSIPGTGVERLASCLCGAHVEYNWGKEPWSRQQRQTYQSSCNERLSETLFHFPLGLGNGKGSKRPTPELRPGEKRPLHLPGKQALSKKRPRGSCDATGIDSQVRNYCQSSTISGESLCPEGFPCLDPWQLLDSGIWDAGKFSFQKRHY